MITLFKQGKVYYKVENGNLIGGQLVSCPTQEVANTFIEFDSQEQAKEHFGIEAEDNPIVIAKTRKSDYVVSNEPLDKEVPEEVVE